MRHYENMLIVKPTLTEEETKSQMAEIDEIITSNGGEILGRDPMGMKKLAYPIEKNMRGFYYVVYHTMAPASIAEVERRFRINETLLRFVTMKYDSKREVAAWTKMVDAIKPPKVETPVTPAVEATPAAEAAVEATPAVEETPAAEATPATEATQA